MVLQMIAHFMLIRVSLHLFELLGYHDFPLILLTWFTVAGKQFFLNNLSIPCQFDPAGDRFFFFLSGISHTSHLNMFYLAVV